MYSLGMTTTDIQKHLFEMYNYKVSTGLISEVTNAVINDLREWQARHLEPTHPIYISIASSLKCVKTSR